MEWNQTYNIQKQGETVYIENYVTLTRIRISSYIFLITAN